MNQYTRVTATPGKSYFCGCDIQRENLGTWQAPNYVNREKCRVHDSPVAVEQPVPVAGKCSGCANIWCVCNRVKCDEDH